MTKVLILIGLIFLYLVLMTFWVIKHSRVYNVDYFKDSEKLYALPVITMYEGNVKLNFLVDSGSTHSHLAPSILKNLHYTENNSSKVPLYGYGGANDPVETVNITLTLNHNSSLVKGTFMVHKEIEDALDQAFNMHDRIKVHGIIGNDFLKSNGYIIDYSDFSIKKRR